MIPPSAVEDVLARVRPLHDRPIDPGLARVRRLLEALGAPEQRLPPVVQVAGTNGKGSTLAFARAILEAAGWRVHAYTSPHLVRRTEMVRLAGRLVEEPVLAAALEEGLAVNRGQPITEFELLTAVALRLFADTPADVLLLETLMGGRLDATNVVARPAVTAITRISYDHRAFLGETLAGIAAHKAGILRAGVQAVLAPQSDPDVRQVLGHACAAVGAPVLTWDISRLDPSAPRMGTGDGAQTPAAPAWVYLSERRRLELPWPTLVGGHQVINAAVATACVDGLEAATGRAIPDAAIGAGWSLADWPGRLQRLVLGRLVRRLPAGWELWLDGGHNDSGGEVLAAQAAVWQEEAPARPLYLVFGMLDTKVPGEFLAPLRPFIHATRTVGIPGDARSLSAPAAAAACRAAGLAEVRAAASVPDALDDLVATSAGRPASLPPCRVLICGSLALVGHCLTLDDTVPVSRLSFPPARARGPGAAGRGGLQGAPLWSPKAKRRG